MVRGWLMLRPQASRAIGLRDFLNLHSATKMPPLNSMHLSILWGTNGCTWGLYPSLPVTNSINFYVINFSAAAANHALTLRDVCTRARDCFLVQHLHIQKKTMHGNSKNKHSHKTLRNSEWFTVQNSSEWFKTSYFPHLKLIPWGKSGNRETNGQH